MKVAIAGGGIGGLTAALCLHEIGVDVSIYESVSELRELGVGINILPHAAKIYAELGIADRLLESGVELRYYSWFNKFGQEIWTEPRGRNAGYKWPQISIHRGKFHSILADVVRERLGAEAINCNRHIDDFEREDKQVIARFLDRQTGQHVETVTADALIGADGIHSAVRSKFYPDEGPPRWSGNMLWRTTVEIDPVRGGQTMIAAGHAAQKIVGYGISNEARQRGKSLFNWIAEVRIASAQSPLPAREDWNRQSDFSEFLPYFEDWKFEWLDIRKLARRSGSVWAFPMVDRDPVEAWSFDNITLLGDAAHSMWPIGSNGASQAILDCRSIADQLAEHGNIVDAFAAYDRERRPATTAIVLANRANAHDEILEIAEERAPNGFRHISEVAEADELDKIVAKYRQTALFDKKQLQ